MILDSSIQSSVQHYNRIYTRHLHKMSSLEIYEILNDSFYNKENIWLLVDQNRTGYK